MKRKAHLAGWDFCALIKSVRLCRRRGLLAAAALGAAVATAFPAGANTCVWLGGVDDQWSTAANWTSGRVPGAYPGDSLSFGVSARVNPHNDLAPGAVLADAIYGPSAPAFTLSGSAIALTHSIVNNSTNNQVINLPLTLSPSGQTTVLLSTTSIGGTLTLAGPLSGSSGITCTANYGSQAPIVLAAANTYTGPTIVQQGTLRLGAAGALPAGTALTFGASGLGSTSTLDLGGYDATVSSLTCGGTHSSAQVTGSGTLTYAGGVSTYWGKLSNSGLIVSRGTLTIADSVVAGTTAVNCPVTVNSGATLRLGAGSVSGGIRGSGEVRFAAGASGAVTLGGALACTGPITIESGALKLASAPALEDTPGGALTVAPGAALDVSALNDATFRGKPLFIGGAGASGNGALVCGGARNTNYGLFSFVTLTDSVLFGGDACYGFGSNATYHPWSTPYTPPGGMGTLSTGGRPYSITKSGGGILALADMAVDSALGDVNITKGILALSGKTTGLGDPAYTLTLGEVAGLYLNLSDTAFDKRIVSQGGYIMTFGPSSTIGGSRRQPMVLQSQAGTGTAIWPYNPTSTITINTQITGPGRLDVVGSGSCVLNGDTDYSGGTMITRATLTLGAAERLLDTGPMALISGTFDTAGFSETLGTLVVSAHSQGGDCHLDLGDGASVVHFLASGGLAWDGMLTIDHWSGDFAGGGADQLVFGSDAGGLTPAQLSRITFAGYPAGARMLPTGEVIPVPEPASLAVLLLGLGAGRRPRRGRGTRQ